MAAPKLIDPNVRRAAVAGIKRGELTVSEVATLLQVGKSSVSRWCRFDVALARDRHVVRIWSRITGGRRRG